MIKINHALDHLRLFLEKHEEELGVSPRALDRIRGEIADFLPLDQNKQEIWNSIVAAVQSGAKKGQSARDAHDIYELFYALTDPPGISLGQQQRYDLLTLETPVGSITSTLFDEYLPTRLPWLIDNPRSRNARLLLSSENGVRTHVERPLRLSSYTAKIDLTRATMVSAGRMHETYFFGDIYWTIFRDHDGSNSDSGSFPQGSLPRFDKLSSRKRFLIEKDTILALRSILEEMGLYHAKAVISERIQIVDGATAKPLLSYTGFGAKALPGGTWTPLISQDDNGSVLNVPAGLTETVASNLITIIHVLKQMGIVMRSWSNTMVNVRTGEISLGEGDVPVLFAGERFKRAIEDLPFFFAGALASTPHMLRPNLALILSRNGELFKSDLQINRVLNTLHLKSDSAEYTINEMKEQLLEDFSLLVEYLNNPYLNEVIRDPHRVEIISDIITYYIETLQARAPYSFMARVLPPILGYVEPSRWFDVASRLIDGAVQSGADNMEHYWINHAAEIWRALSAGNGQPKKWGNGEDGNGGGSSTPPVQGGPSTGSAPIGTIGGSSTPQAKAVTSVLQSSINIPTLSTVPMSLQYSNPVTNIVPLQMSMMVPTYMHHPPILNCGLAMF